MGRPLIQETRIQSALDDVAGSGSRHVIGCRLTQETRVQSALDGEVARWRNFNPVEPSVESARPTSLHCMTSTCDKLRSSFAFNFNLRRYAEVPEMNASNSSARFEHGGLLATCVIRPR